MPGRPTGIWRAIPIKKDPRKRGKEESLSRLKNIRAFAEVGAAAPAPLAASARRAPLPRSGGGRDAAGIGALRRAGLRRAPSWSSPPPPGGLCRQGPTAGGVRPGSRARRPLGSLPRERSARSATWASLCCFFPTPSFSFCASPSSFLPSLSPFLLPPPFSSRLRVRALALPPFVARSPV